MYFKNKKYTEVNILAIWPKHFSLYDPQEYVFYFTKERRP